jgi:hypothetical protein
VAIEFTVLRRSYPPTVDVEVIIAKAQIWRISEEPAGCVNVLLNAKRRRIPSANTIAI